MIEQVTVANFSDLINFERALKSDSKVQLWVDSKQLFLEKLESIAEVLSSNSHKIISLRGPTLPTKGVTIFEDTVQVATQLEDYFDVELKYLTTSARYGWRSVAELYEFYERGLNIFVEDFGNPIDTVIQIAKANMDIKMSWNGLNISSCWYEEEILLSLSPFIGEVDLSELAPPGNTLAFLEQQPELFYVFN